jgi:CheY-like chemotaxis protein
MTQASLPSVMVVDDDHVLRSLVCRRLEHFGYQVFEAADGDKAIAKLETVQPNVLLTDIVMPDREGVETIIEIRRRWPQVKIVAMSGGGRIGPEMFLALASNFGASAVIRKPFKFGELIEVLSGLATAA